jgi:saccharopine dehydrogenase (NAD+, L-lysine forming)
MNTIKLGIIKEGKIPHDKRVPLTPAQCKILQEKFKNIKIFVQPSNHRAFTDEEYMQNDISLNENLINCDILMGIKEVPCDDLIPNKTYLFFSHTIKKQAHNSKLLRTILEKKIRLIDYELITDKNNKRLIGFGRFAGIAGIYSGLRSLGLKTKTFELKFANQCKDFNELTEELKKVKLPENFKMVLTGQGRVGMGTREILSLLDIKEVTAEVYLNQTFTTAVFTQIDAEDYYASSVGASFNKLEFYKEPQKYTSDFLKFAKVSDMYVACHFWDSKAPIIISKADFLDKDFRIKYIADISCDVDGPIASTIRSSTIEEPYYGYDPKTGEEVSYNHPDSILVMAVDNLPCELPRDASEYFGNELIKNVLPFLFGNDTDGIIERAAETNSEGKLNNAFKYLQDYAEGK